MRRIRSLVGESRRRDRRRGPAAEWSVRSYRPGDEEAIVALFHDACRGYGGYVVRTVAHWRWCILERPGMQWDDILLLVDDREAPVGYGVLSREGALLEFAITPSLALSERRRLAATLLAALEGRGRALGCQVIGGSDLVLMAGPCSVETRSGMMRIGEALSEAGATFLRGGAFKPRSSPYSFRGLAEEGLEILAEVREATGLRLVTEVMSPDQVGLVAQYADILQLGARNMQNFPLLDAVGRSGMPVLLKRGMMSTIEEFLLSAEYILSHGNPDVILCERGIRTFEPSTRNSLDINSVPLLHELTHLPVLVDPSHATGKSSLVTAVSRAAIAAGADGLLVEVHDEPEIAWSDGQQTLSVRAFRALIEDVARIADAVDRRLAPHLAKALPRCSSSAEVQSSG